MKLIASHSKTNERIESFSVKSENWKQLKGCEKGSIIHPMVGYPMMAVTSPTGLQYFRFYPGHTIPNPKPESEEHIRAKLIAYEALRKAGYSAWLEHEGYQAMRERGRPIQEDRWEPDVLLEAGGLVIALEIQISGQTLDDYLERTARYQRAGILCVWLTSFNQFQRLNKAITYRFGPSADRIAIGDGRVCVPEFPAFVLKEDFAVMVFGESPDEFWRAPVSLEDFACGAAQGRIYFSQADLRWYWKADGEQFWKDWLEHLRSGKASGNRPKPGPEG
jgi:hypothetical protein